MGEGDKARVSERGHPGESRELPDWFGPVAEDVLRYCRPQRGLWVDLGSGSGGLGFALVQKSESAVALVEPNAGALVKAVERARSEGLAGRVVPIVGTAEKIPLPDASVDLVVSRGSIFFWGDPPQGLREVYRVDIESSEGPDLRARCPG